ncbi:MAG: hypothetical protein V1835_05115 [Candidatus Micrarchaeota archaeon]
MERGTIRFSPEEIASYDFGQRGNEFARRLLLSPLDVREAGGLAKVMPAIDAISKRMPGSLVFLNSRGREIAGTKPARFRFVRFNPDMIDGDGRSLPFILGPASLLKNQGRRVWQRLEKGPATEEEIRELLLKYGNLKRESVPSIIYQINNTLRNGTVSRPIMTMRRSDGKYIIGINANARTLYQLGAPTADCRDHLDPKYRKIAALFEEKGRWRIGELMNRAGLPIDNAKIYLNIFSDQLVRFGYPQPIITGGKDKSRWTEITEEYAKIAGIDSPLQLTSFFKPKDSKIIEYIAANPGASNSQISRDMLIPMRTVGNRIKSIQGVIKDNALPPIYSLFKFGHGVSALFAKKFGLNEPINDLQMFLRGDKLAIFGGLEGAETKHKVLAKQLSIPRHIFSQHVEVIKKILESTHLPAAVASEKLGISISDMQSISDLVPAVVFKGKAWVSRSIMQYDIAHEESKVKEILSKFTERVENRNTRGSTEREMVHLSKFPAFILRRLLARFNEEIGSLGAVKPNEPQKVRRKRNLILNVDLLENTIAKKMR